MVMKLKQIEGNERNKTKEQQTKSLRRKNKSGQAKNQDPNRSIFKEENKT